MSSDDKKNPTFQSLFCERFQCAPAEFAERAFQETLYPHARFITALARKLWPAAFAEDFKFLGYLGQATSLVEVAAEVDNFRDLNRTRGDTLRTVLKMRVSGRRASRLAQELFGRERNGSRSPRSEPRGGEPASQ
jgi:hypothetical protein